MYKVVLAQEARRDLAKLDKGTISRILSRLRWLAKNIERLKLEPLKGELEDYYKLKVGDYRVLYFPSRTRQRIFVHSIGHRREIYGGH